MVPVCQRPMAALRNTWMMTLMTPSEASQRPADVDGRHIESKPSRVFVAVHTEAKLSLIPQERPTKSGLNFGFYESDFISFLIFQTTKVPSRFQ